MENKNNPRKKSGNPTNFKRKLKEKEWKRQREKGKKGISVELQWNFWVWQGGFIAFCVLRGCGGREERRRRRRVAAAS